MDSHGTCVMIPKNHHGQREMFVMIFEKSLRSKENICIKVVSSPLRNVYMLNSL